MKKIKFTAHPSGGLLIKGFTPMVAMAICLKISGMEYKSLYPQSDGSIWRMSNLYTVYTTAMSLQLALKAIGENLSEYTFETDISEKEILIGDFNKSLGLNSFNFTKKQFIEIGKIDKPIGVLLANSNYKTVVPYSIVEEGLTLNDVNAISSIFEFTDKTPLYATTFDSGGRSMDEGFGTAIIAKSTDGLFYPYLVVCNEGQRVDKRDVLENYDNSSFLLLSPQRSSEDAKNALLDKYDECVRKIKPLMVYDKDGEYWEEPYDFDSFDSVDNFLLGFTTIFDGYFDENYTDAKNQLARILSFPHFYKLDTESNWMSTRELNYFKNTKEFKSFVFKNDV